MYIHVLEIIGGLVLLFGGGEVLVRGSVGIARSFGMPIIVIGLTIVAYGTSAPELVVSMQAAMKGSPDIALGNVIGSNISNILLVLGVSSLIFPIACKTNKRDTLVMIGVTALLIAMSFDGELGRIDGLILVSAIIAYTIVVFKTTRNPEESVEDEILHIKMPVWKGLLYIFIGVALLIIGSDLLVEGGITIARSIGVSEAVIGLTIVAVGSSAPELITSVVAAFRRHSDIAVGNIIGSNIVNIMGILGTTSAISPIVVDEKFLRVDYWVLLGVTILMVVSLKTGKHISRIEGGLFFAGYIAYTVFQFYGT